MKTNTEILDDLKKELEENKKEINENLQENEIKNNNFKKKKKKKKFKNKSIENKENKEDSDDILRIKKEAEENFYLSTDFLKRKEIF